MTSEPLASEARLLRADVAELTKVVAALAKRFGVSRRVIIGLVVSFALDLLLTVGLVTTQIQGVGYVHCQAHYNDVNNQRTRALTETADQERAAQRRTDDAEAALFTSPVLAKPADKRTPQDQQQIADLFKEYQDALTAAKTQRAVADKVRKEHPVPPPPSQTCG